MITSVSDYNYVTGADVDADHPHGDLDRILINGGIMPLRTGVSSTTGVANANILRGEDIAFLIERGLSTWYSFDGMVARPSYNQTFNADLNEVATYIPSSYTFSRKVGRSQAEWAVLVARQKACATEDDEGQSVWGYPLISAIESLPTSSVYSSKIEDVVTKIPSYTGPSTSSLLQKSVIEGLFNYQRTIKYAIIENFGTNSFAPGGVSYDITEQREYAPAQTLSPWRFESDHTVEPALGKYVTYWTVPSFVSFGKIPRAAMSSASLWLSGIINVSDTSRGASGSSQFSMKIADGAISGEYLEFTPNVNSVKDALISFAQTIDPGFNTNPAPSGESKMMQVTASSGYCVTGSLNPRTNWW